MSWQHMPELTVTLNRRKQHMNMWILEEIENIKQALELVPSLQPLIGDQLCVFKATLTKQDLISLVNVAANELEQAIAALNISDFAPVLDWLTDAIDVITSQLYDGLEETNT